MSKLNRDKLKKMILKEMRMIGMASPAPMGVMGMSGGDSHVGSHDHGCDACGMSPCGCDEYNELGEEALLPAHTSSATPMMGSGHGSVSREACCAAVMCLIECCSCPVTKEALMECCQEIMSGDYDH